MIERSVAASFGRESAVVIGGGPAGLTAAHELCGLGVRPVVLEADQQVGGISRTVGYRGYRFDIGGHRFFSKDALVNEFWQKILGDEMLVRPRVSRIFYRNHFFDYPLRATNALSGLGPLEAVRCTLSYARASLRRKGDEKTFEQWVSNRFGRRLYEIFFKTYTEKVWGIPCHEISADWAAQRIKNLSLGEALRNALTPRGGRDRNGETITSLIERFLYPRLGPGMMWERCESEIAHQGAETLRGMRVTKIRHRAGRVECVVAEDEQGRACEFGGDHFLSSMPLRELIAALAPAPPADVLRAARALRYRDYLTVVLIVGREKVFPDNWIYVHSPEVKLGRIQNYKNWSPEMVPDGRRTSLGLEYFLWDRDEEWTWSLDQWIDRGIRECSQIGLIEPDEVEDGTLVRMPKAYPVYDQSTNAQVATVRSYLAGFENLESIGRNGQHRYNNQDHSMLTGIYAARNSVGADYDVWGVNVDEEYHEEVRATQPEIGPRSTSGVRLVPQRLPAREAA